MEPPERGAAGDGWIEQALSHWITQGWYRCPAGVVDLLGRMPPLRFRAAWWHESCGRIGRAAALLPPRAGNSKLARYAARLRDFQEVLETGHLTLPEPATENRPSPLPFKGRTVMALYGSEPWMTAGYGVRTRCLLRALEGRGIACTPVTRPNFPADWPGHDGAPVGREETADGVTYRRLVSPVSHQWDSPRRYIEAFADGLVEIARETGASLLHAASNHIVGLAASLAATRLGLPWVYEIRGLWHRTTVSRRPGWERSELYRIHEALERQAAMRADRVVTLSEELARHVAGWGVPRDRISTVPNGVDEALFEPSARNEALRRDLGATDETLLVGFIGTFTPYEGLDRLIQAATALRSEGLEISLALVGDGEEERALRSLARRLGAPTVFAGRVPFDRVPAYYHALDLCAFPRRNLDATRLTPPLKLAEAMASGLPVLVSDLPALTEVVTDGHDGLVAGQGPDDLKEGLRRLADDPGLRRRLGAAGRERVRDGYRWQDQAGHLAELYRGLSTGAPIASSAV